MNSFHVSLLRLVMVPKLEAMNIYNYCDSMPLSQVVLILSYYIHTVAGIVIATIIVIISLVIGVAVLFMQSRSKKRDLNIPAQPQVHTLLSCITCVEVLPSNVIKFMIHIDIFRRIFMIRVQMQQYVPNQVCILIE